MNCCKLRCVPPFVLCARKRKFLPAELVALIFGRKARKKRERDIFATDLNAFDAVAMECGGV